MQLEFKFEPKQHVIISAYGLDYLGRVMRLTHTPSGNQYDVEFAADGKVQVGTFFEDELGVP